MGTTPMIWWQEYDMPLDTSEGEFYQKHNYPVGGSITYPYKADGTSDLPQLQFRLIPKDKIHHLRFGQLIENALGFAGLSLNRLFGISNDELEEIIQDFIEFLDGKEAGKTDIDAGLRGQGFYGLRDRWKEIKASV